MRVLVHPAGGGGGLRALFFGIISNNTVRLTGYADFGGCRFCIITITLIPGFLFIWFDGLPSPWRAGKPASWLAKIACFLFAEKIWFLRSLLHGASCCVFAVDGPHNYIVVD